MTVDECRALEALRDNSALHPSFEEGTEDFDFGDVWNGTEALPISHAGGEFNDLARGILGDTWKIQDGTRGVRRVDNRTRRDRVLRRNEAFTKQIPAMTDAYLVWSLEKSRMGHRSFFDQSHKGELEDGSEWAMTIVDKVILKISSTDNTVASALVRQALELYRVAHLRSPHLSVQAFVKTMSDLHGIEFHRHLSRQFSIAFDLYLEIRRCVATMVAKALQRDSPDWRVKHTCPACSYILANEEQLTFKMLRSLDDDDTLGISSELPTGQIHTSDRYLSRTFVDQFTRDLPPATGDESTPADNLCEGRWKNMDDMKTMKAWGIYDETGVFVAVCRHRFCLLIADMVQSGELAKYPLAVVARLLDVFGDGLGGGYDIGCQFKVTLDNSSLGPLVRSLNHTCLVGAFHGHAHRRLCQLFSLTTYIKGLGIEDLETCERTFSKSNALASSLRYASVFHRQQAIDSYFEHNDDFEVYANLSNFLHNNYKQALDILANGNAVLPNMMRDLGVADDGVFERWLDEEKAYLKGLTHEPEEETLQMEYWQRLVNLKASSLYHEALLSTLQPLCFQWIPTTTSHLMTPITHRHVVEDYERSLKLVQVLECKLEVIMRWVPDDAEWQKARTLVANRKYQRAVDRLEGLVVARIFELTKMNRAGTGYRLRKHIAKALQTRSVAIRSALNTYNTVATAMSPPRQTLKWEEVVDYAFLSDFDLLRNTRADVSQTPWATPGARSAMDLYFKMCRAQEEISRLNVEIRRLDNYLRTCEDQLKFRSPALAHQLAIHRNTRGRFNARHLKRLHNISTLPGFSGTLLPGLSARMGSGESANNPSSAVLCADSYEDLDEEEEEEEMAEEASRNLQDVLLITDDFARLELNDSLIDLT
ncbi:uncharacterized protein F5891DRAFT_1131377 [Suillus fuscotomentosus]|uniref:CxC1-like cysteine cluster associated with KDZ transposases domain-containing protein n=1 Tax=Suillus fuscotomentosus TaxID=1912939 RepID=A0AAD4HF39_9AGAM|nr:uncharacterized protein F5891DRAFT_1131377 [Suillus fuscotomentosus]KAG1893159.1 hypothetical protein F5891DRAFT_1131377 [Suillus fuscotomentosus]